MKLTAKGRYAVSAMADIAHYAGASDDAVSSPVSAPEIAIRQNISVGYLEQVLMRLRKAGLIVSARGANGGFSLAREAEAIRIAEIVAAADEEIRTTACEPGSAKGCQGTSARCLTHDLWDELGRQIDIFLNSVTLQDVLDRRVLGMATLGRGQVFDEKALEAGR
ncbi:MAG: RrF2 family transcriptional regulator [Pseudomonadota bacterium]